MKKYIMVLFGLLIFVNQHISSQAVSQETAQRVAENFFHAQTSTEPQRAMQVKLVGSRELPAMYAFSLPDRWVLVSGDRRVEPILAYSDGNSTAFPDEEDMPPAMAYMLHWYSEQINALRSDNIEHNYNVEWDDYMEANNATLINNRAIVNPLLRRDGNENIWNQSGNNTPLGYSIDTTRVYNKFCPIIAGCSNPHAVVGCVAVATAQVMWYWQWPYAAIVRDDDNNIFARYYDWNLMPYQLTNSSSLAEANMIANLLHDVGVAVKMNYGCNGSGAYTDSIIPALQNVYRYNTGGVLKRSQYTDDNWISIVKNELNNLRPVLYGGVNNNGGHQFVVDGYAANNKFHINYGWGGNHNNDYYSLNSIYNGYNYSQTMIINVYPNYPSCLPITTSQGVWNVDFVIQNGGGINIGNRIVLSGNKGFVISGEYVNLMSGFQVNEGAEVYIDIKDMHCDDDRSTQTTDEINEESQRIPPKQTNITDAPPACKIFRNGQILIERNGKTYTLTGGEWSDGTATY